MKMKKSVPALPVQNIDNAIEFYKTKLGFSVPYYEDDFAKLITPPMFVMSKLILPQQLQH